jgi:probable HAF family extracellular repeat protein
MAAEKKKEEGNMKSRFLICITALLVATLAIPVQLAAQQKQHHNKHHHYKFIDLGTFGGPQSWVDGAGEGPAPTLNNEGVVIGAANTPDSNPSYSYPCDFFSPSFLCAFFGTPDPFVEHAFHFEDGALTDLGVLPGGSNSVAMWISTSGSVVGVSENGIIDPLIGVPEGHAVVFQDGQPKDIGTFGGYESTAFAVNNHGQVVGTATNAANNGHAFLWSEDKGLQDLGTLGASLSLANLINDRGQISGVSGLCDTCNQDVFFWERGTMQRIPDFGGSISFPDAINNRGQVVGQSNLAGDQSWHGFLWEKGVLTDLLTLGGCCSGARWMNESGEIVGYAYDVDQLNLAVLWKDGKIQDVIGTVDGDACAVAQSINSARQVVGISDAACDGTVLHAFLWEKGGPAVDLNTFVPPGSGLQLTQATSINDRGEIAGWASTSDGNNHAFLQIPCDEHHPGVEGCDYSMMEAPTAVPRTSPAVRDASSRTPPQSLMRRMNRYHLSGRATGPTN